jgi:hypothetical protein
LNVIGREDTKIMTMTNKCEECGEVALSRATFRGPYVCDKCLGESVSLKELMTEFKRKIILSWHNLMDTAEYVANHFDITFPSDCKSRPGYVLDEMLEIVNTISRQDNPTNIGNLGYIAVPHINSSNELVITFYVDVAANNDYQKMEYLGGREMRIRL